MTTANTLEQAPPLRLAADGSLVDPDALWDIPVDWVEEPNVRRGGWSGVSRAVAIDTDGREVPLFVKHQKNHNFRTWGGLRNGKPTFYREWCNFRRCQTWRIATAEVLHYAERGTEAILVTRGLTTYVSFDVALKRCDTDSKRQALLTALGEMLAKLHVTGWRHGGLYCKHVLVDTDTWDIRLIDLEKMRHRFNAMDAAFRDLSQLQRGTVGFTDDDLDTLLAPYSRILVVPQLRTLIERRSSGKSSRGTSSLPDWLMSLGLCISPRK